MNTAAGASKDIEAVEGVAAAPRPASPEMRRALDLIATSCSSPDLTSADVEQIMVAVASGAKVDLDGGGGRVNPPGALARVSTRAYLSLDRNL